MLVLAGASFFLQDNCLWSHSVSDSYYAFQISMTLTTTGRLYCQLSTYFTPFYCFCWWHWTGTILLGDWDKYPDQNFITKIGSVADLHGLTKDMLSSSSNHTFITNGVLQKSISNLKVNIQHFLSTKIIQNIKI